MSVNFGYELDLTKFTEEDDVEVKRQVQAYKSVRRLILFGGRYRLRLKGLNPEADYEAVDTGIVYGGDELMRIGISVPVVAGDFQSYVVAFKRVD